MHTKKTLHNTVGGRRRVGEIKQMDWAAQDIPNSYSVSEIGKER
jgi:hypothetical protein